MAVVGSPGVGNACSCEWFIRSINKRTGKSKLLNILATRHLVGQKKIAEEDVGKFPLPSAQNQSHITKCFFSLRYAEQYKVVPKFCIESEFQRRVAMQKATMTYPNITDEILFESMTLKDIR